MMPGIVIHILDCAHPLCGFSGRYPTRWPVGHTFLRFGERGSVTCEVCAAEARKKFPEGHRALVLWGLSEPHPPVAETFAESLIGDTLVLTPHPTDEDRARASFAVSAVLAHEEKGGTLSKALRIKIARKMYEDFVKRTAPNEVRPLFHHLSWSEQKQFHTIAKMAMEARQMQRLHSVG